MGGLHERPSRSLENASMNSKDTFTRETLAAAMCVLNTDFVYGYTKFWK